MRGGEEQMAAVAPVVYCLIPCELAPRLHEALRRHFDDDASVEVIVERRGAERRAGIERRQRLVASPGPDRRRIRSFTGRRVAARRATLASVAGPDLPRRARVHADRLAFVERLEASAQQREDFDSAGLVNRIQAGDREAFASLYLRYFDRVFSYSKVALRDMHAAEELTQQVFVKVLDALPRYQPRPGTPLRAWLFTIVRNEAVKEVQRRGRSQATDPSVLDRQREEIQPDAAEPAIPEWLSDRELVMFFERLPFAQRQVLMLRYMLNFNYPEIAAIMDRSEVDVRSLHSRGLRFLRARLGALAPEVPRQRRHAIRARVRWARVASSRRWALHA